VNVELPDINPLIYKKESKSVPLMMYQLLSMQNGAELLLRLRTVLGPYFRKGVGKPDAVICFHRSGEPIATSMLLLQSDAFRS